MSAYKDAIAVAAASSEEQLAMAAEVLASGSGVVFLEGSIALRPAGSYLICEVVDPTPAARRCENEFAVLVENAQRALESSQLRACLPDLPLKWRVVEDNGTSVSEWWRAP